MKFTWSKGLTQRQVRVPHFGDRTTKARLAPFKPVPQKGGDGRGHQDRKRHRPGQSGLAARRLPDANDLAQIPAVHAGKRPAISGLGGAPPPPRTRRSPNRSRRRPWGLTLKAAPTGDQLVLTLRARSPDARAAARAPRPPSPRADSMEIPGQPLPGPRGAAPAPQFRPGARAPRLHGSGPRRTT